MIKKNFLSILIFFFAISCSTDITIAKINKPSYKLQKKSIKGIKILNEHFFQDDSKTVKKILEEEKYFFERKIENRNRIFDSLNLIKKDKIVIIDSKKDNNGNRIESSYFFYDNTVVYSFFLIEDSIINREVFRRYIPKTEEILNIFF